MALLMALFFRNCILPADDQRYIEGLGIYIYIYLINYRCSYIYIYKCDYVYIYIYIYIIYLMIGVLSYLLHNFQAISGAPNRMPSGHH